MSDLADFREYAQTRDPALRERLIEENLGLVYSQAVKFARQLPRTILLDDLKSWGSIGLIDAVEKFEPERGLAFSTYGVLRIRGAMLDGMQTQEWLPKAKITRLRELGNAQDALEAEGALGSIAEIAERMKITPDEVRGLLHDRSSKAVRSLDEERTSASEDDDSPRSAWQAVIGDQEPSAELAEISTRTFAALAQLSADEASVIERIYCDGITLKDLAAERGQAPGSVATLHSRALARIRDLLALFGEGPRPATS